MSKVKEEFYLSLIFIGKWLALGLGAFGILYFAINIAYKKSYYEPRMASFDLEIQELTESKTKSEEEITALKGRSDLIIEKISLIERTDIPNSEEDIKEAKAEIEKLGLKWWEKYEIPLLSRNPSADLAYKNLDYAKTKKSTAVSERDSLQKEKNSIISDSNKLAQNIRKIDETIAAVKQKKRRAQVDVKGPLLWLVGILGLT